MIHLYVNSEIVDYIDGIDLKVDPDIKRKLRVDVIDVEVSYEINTGEGSTMVGIETYGGEPSGNVFSVGMQVVGTVQVFVRKASGEEEDCGTLLVMNNQMSRTSLGMSDWAEDNAVNGMVATLQVQRWLEQQGILDKDPSKDKNNIRILADVVDGKPVARILPEDEEVSVVAYEE